MNDRAPPTLEIRIDELVLHGFAPRDRQRIASAIETALVRLFAERGLPTSVTQAATRSEVPGGTMPNRPGDRFEQIGTQVARAVYEGLNG